MNPDPVYVDIGATWLRVGRATNEPLVTRTPQTGEALVREIVSLVGDVDPDAPIGIACPGVITREGHVALSFLTAVNGMQLRDTIASCLNRDVLVINDVAAQALGVQSEGRLVYFGFGTRVGGAIREEDNAFQHRHRFQGEFGHLSCGITSTEQCECGAHDCLDLQVAGYRLERRYGDWWTSSRGVSEVCEAIAAPIANAIRSVLVVAGPDVVALGGALAGHEPLQSAVRELLGATVWTGPELVFLPESWPLSRRGLARALALNNER